MEEKIRKRKREKGEKEGEEEESIALSNTNQESVEDILEMFFNVANKLRKTIANAKTTKAIKTNINHDIDKMQSFITKL